MTDDISKLVERIEAANIVQLAANAFNVSVDDVLGRKRPAHIVSARSVAMRLIWEMRSETGRRLHGITQLGRLFNRSHATAFYLIDTFNDRARLYTEMTVVYQRISSALCARSEP